ADIALDHIGEVLGRAAQWLVAEFTERGSELRRFQALVDLDIELVDHVARRVGRRQQPGPTRRDEAGEAALGHGRQVRQFRDALAAGGGRRAKLAALDQPRGRVWPCLAVQSNPIATGTTALSCAPLCGAVHPCILDKRWYTKSRVQRSLCPPQAQRQG